MAEQKDIERFLNDPIQDYAWMTETTLTGLNFKATEDGWLLVVKRDHAVLGRQVAFLGSASIMECIDYLIESAQAKKDFLSWRKDKY